MIRLERTAFIIPCLNEELTVARVVADCLAALPTASVYVFDNGSTDATARVAAGAGARVIWSPERGKGNVLRQAFRELNYDYLVMIDGDGTYPADETPRLLKLAREANADMVCGARLQLGRPEAFRPLHYLGNLIFTGLVRVFFGHPVQDLLTGFRVFSGRFARTVQLQSRGFEVETELTIRALAEGWVVREVAVPYAERPAGSHSKLRTFRDGFVIARTMIRLLFSRLLFSRRVHPADRARNGDRAA